MNPKDFSQEQQQALLDLAMLAMYSDGNLTTAEDLRVRKLLGALGYETDYDRGREFDASISRIARNSQSKEAARSHSILLARRFSGPEQKMKVQEIIEDVLSSDGSVERDELEYLEVVKEALQS